MNVREVYELFFSNKEFTYKKTNQMYRNFFEFFMIEEMKEYNI
jgi:hypothetical protein